MIKEIKTIEVQSYDSRAQLDKEVADQVSKGYTSVGGLSVDISKRGTKRTQRMEKLVEYQEYIENLVYPALFVSAHHDFSILHLGPGIENNIVVVGGSKYEIGTYFKEVFIRYHFDHVPLGYTPEDSKLK